MRRGQGGRLAVPTIGDLMKADEQEREVVACSGLRFGPLTALTIALHNGDTATVCLNDIGSVVLLDALRALFPNSTPTSAALVKETANGIEVQVGHLSA
jgi:hypothetical protein